MKEKKISEKNIINTLEKNGLSKSVQFVQNVAVI